MAHNGIIRNKQLKSEILSSFKRTRENPDDNVFKHVKKCHEFMYLNNVKRGSDLGKEEVDENIFKLRKYIASLYFDCRATFNVDDNFMDLIKTLESPSNVKEDINDTINGIIRLIKCIFLKSKDDIYFRWKIRTDDIQMYFNLSMVDENQIELIISRFNGNTKVCTVLPLIFRYIDKKWYLTHDALYYVVRREKDLKTSFMEDTFMMNGYFNKATVAFIYKCIQKYIQSYSTLKEYDYKNMEHSILEINIFKIIFTHVEKDIHNIIGYYNPNIQSGYKHIDDNEILDVINNRNGKYPIVNLNQKEWDYIDRYINKQYPDYIDLRQALEMPRYGDILTLRYINTDIGDDVIINIGFKYFPDKDAARFFMVNHENRSVTSFAMVDVLDVSKFKDYENTLSIHINIKYLDDTLFASTDEVYKNIPRLFQDPTLIQELWLKYVYLQVAIYDKPERVREVQKVKSHNNDSNSNKKSQSKTENLSSKDFVIERILMTKKDASEYVKKMSGQHKDVEYVLETWLRKGHYKRARNGKMIWIDATMCKRHLPLVQKEIQIRL